MVLDAGKPHFHREILTRELESVGMRLNRSPPDITFRKKKTGGLTINSLVPLTHLDDKLIYRILQARAPAACVAAAAAAVATGA
jgi:ribosome-interacting GTPase 1